MNPLFVAFMAFGSVVLLVIGILINSDRFCAAALLLFLASLRLSRE